MSNRKPWLDRWQVKEDIGRGGQGTTFLVTKKSEGTEAVLKVLRMQSDPEARRRMFQEVNNLKVLQNARCKVPAILDSNTDKFESLDVPLYFVMEQVVGSDLNTVVSSAGGLDLPKSAEIVLDLLSTIRTALDQEVIHRDLKPENIMIRSLDPVDAVIVDYGISFNKREHGDVTRVSETLDNRFLSLPERRVPGGDRRDPRSDLTGLCGILYFCLTGERPVDLSDASGRLPHRRQGRAVREKISEEARLPQLETFFDRGFSTIIDMRFQTVDEFEGRLREVLSPANITADQDLVSFARESGERLLRFDRKTQLATFKRNSEKVLQAIRDTNDGLFAKKLNPYFAQNVDYENFYGRPAGCELLDLRSAWRVQLAHNDTSFAIVYEIGAIGNECSIFRRLLAGRNVKSLAVVSDWVAILRYDGLQPPDTRPISKDFEGCVLQGMRAIEQEAIGAQK